MEFVFCNGCIIESSIWTRLKHIKFVTFKALFLIVFASSMSFTPHYLQVTLQTHPIFLAKNQLPSLVWEPIHIPALSAFVANLETAHLLCPIRALRYYLDRTKGARANRMRLFLPS